MKLMCETFTNELALVRASDLLFCEDLISLGKIVQEMVAFV